MKENVFDRAAILQYARDYYGTEPECLWMRYPGYQVLRHPENKKWYAVIMDIFPQKLGLPQGDAIDILNIKCDPILAEILQKQPGILPGYHMNKKCWLSLLLDSTLPREEIIKMLGMSYELTK